MKLATFETDGGPPRIGIVDVKAGRILDLAAAAAAVGWDPAPFASMLALIDADDMGLELARELGEGERALGAARRRCACSRHCPQPRQMRDAMSFETHIRQSGRGSRALEARAKGGEAAFRGRHAGAYRTARRSLSADADLLPHQPPHRRRSRNDRALAALQPEMDYELEIAIVTRRTRANIPEAEAADHIFGYTIFNDFSARDRQRAEMAGRLGPAKGKSFDGANVLGPWIVTPDELGDPQTLEVEVRVNGETRAKGATANMLFPLPRSSSPTPRRTRRFSPAKCSAPAPSAIVAGWRSGAFCKAATRSNCMSSASACCATACSRKPEMKAAACRQRQPWRPPASGDKPYAAPNRRPLRAARKRRPRRSRAPVP